jgi:hypothetical protein
MWRSSPISIRRSAVALLNSIQGSCCPLPRDFFMTNAPEMAFRIRQSSSVHCQPMILCRNRPRARREAYSRGFQRIYAGFPVGLVLSCEARGFEGDGNVLDVSQGCLRVQTGPRLIPGRVLHVSYKRQTSTFARCCLVWVQSYGGALPSEAGLEIMGGQAERHAAA